MDKVTQKALETEINRLTVAIQKADNFDTELGDLLDDIQENLLNDVLDKLNQGTTNDN